MNPVKNFSDFLFENKVGPFYNDELNPKFWDKQINKDGDVKYEFDPIVRKKLLKISDDFFSKFDELLGGAKIEDIQLVLKFHDGILYSRRRVRDGTDL